MKYMAFTEYPHLLKGKRIIYNRASNDFNNEPDYKLQRVKIHGELNNSYIVDTGGKKFACDKSQIFLNKSDFENKMDNIKGFKLTTFEKEYLIKQF